MGTIADGFSSGFRDYATDGDAASGAHRPIKSELRALGATIEAVTDALADGSGYKGYQTSAARDADLTQAQGTLALVDGEVRLYRYSASAEAWSDTGIDITDIEAAANAKLARNVTLVAGSITDKSRSSNDWIVSTSEVRLDEIVSGAVVTRIIKEQSAITIPLGSALVADLDAPVDGGGKIVPAVKAIDAALIEAAESGRSVILVSNKFGGLSRHLGGALGFESASGVYDFESWFSTSTAIAQPTWDAASRTLTWPQLIGVLRDRGGQVNKRIKLQAGSIVIPSGQYYVVSLDLAAAVFDETPNTAVSVSKYTDANGWAGQDQFSVPLFAASNELAYPLRFPPVVGATNAPRNKDEVVIVQSANRNLISMPCDGPITDRYITYDFCHFSDAINSLSIGVDVWQVDTVYESRRDGLSTFTSTLQLERQSESEIAIKQDGKADYMGGVSHGDEKLTGTVIMLVDGKPASIDGTSTYIASRVEFLQRSELFEVGTDPAQSTKVADVTKRWIFEKQGYELEVYVKWAAAITLDEAFIGMGPIRRTLDGGTQVFTKGYVAPAYAEQDLTSDTTVAEVKAKKVLATAAIGLSFSWEALTDYYLAGGGGQFRPNHPIGPSSANVTMKWYPDKTGSAYDTTIDEEWYDRFRYRYLSAR